jgi:hypothetical protein
LRTRKAIDREKVWPATTSTALFGRLRRKCGSKRPLQRWQPLTTQAPSPSDGTWALNRTPTCTGPRNGPFRVRIEAGQRGWRRARIFRRISRRASQFMFCGTAPPSERHRESRRGLDMGDHWVRGQSRSSDFLIVVPGPLWRKVFLQKWASAKKAQKGDPRRPPRSSFSWQVVSRGHHSRFLGRPLRGCLAKKNQNQPHQLRNEAQLNCVSLRSSLDCVGAGELSRVEMNALRAPFDSSPRSPRQRERTGCRKKIEESRHVGLTFMTFS